MKVRVKTLPPEWQHVNLARVHPSVMDELRVGPGDLLLVQNPRSQKQALVRLFVRCPMVSLTGYHLGKEDALISELPEIEVDTSLRDYLSDPQAEPFEAEIEAVSVVENLQHITFLTTANLTTNELQELKNFIKSACWPVYPGGEFAVNLTGRTVILKVTEDVSRPAVVEAGTSVTIRGRDDLENLKLQQEILAQEIELNRLKQEEGRLNNQIKQLKKHIYRIEAETKALAEPKQRLVKEESDLKEKFEQVPAQEKELAQKMSLLEIESQHLNNQLSQLAAEVPEVDDIKALQGRRDEKLKKFAELIKALIEKINGFERA